MKVAVLQSVYSGDDPEWFSHACKSILQQKNVSVSLFLAVDGVVPKPLESEVLKLQSDSRVKVYWSDESKGLAARLNQLIDSSLRDDFEFFARMDSDDIAFENRLYEQVKYLSESSSVSVCGSSVVEIDSDSVTINIKSSKSNHNELLKDLLYKCPLNHPTVMFKRKVFESGLRYKVELKNTQDYFMWVDVIKQGFLIGNVEEPLLYFRVSDDFFKRRGFKKVVNEVYSRLYAMKKLNSFSIKGFLYLFLLVLLRLAPPAISRWAYKVFRREVKEVERIKIL